MIKLTKNRIPKTLSWLIFLSIIFFYGNNGQAKDSDNTLGTFFIPEFVENEQSGRFIELVKEIEKRTGNQLKIVLWPPKRTISNFQNGKLIGIFPYVNRFWDKPVEKSIVFHLKREVIFTKDIKAFRNIKDLEGKKVGLTRGFSYSAELLSNPKVKFDYAGTDVLNMKKLSVGRIDAFICEETSGIKALHLSNINDVTYDPSVSISTQKSYFAFQHTERGKQLAKDFSKALREMKQDGTFQKILGVSEEWLKNLPEN